MCDIVLISSKLTTVAAASSILWGFDEFSVDWCVDCERVTESVTVSSTSTSKRSEKEKEIEIPH